MVASATAGPFLLPSLQIDTLRYDLSMNQTRAPRWRIRLAIIATTVVALFGFGAVVATPDTPLVPVAVAHAATSDCPSSGPMTVCGWVDWDFTGVWPSYPGSPNYYWTITALGGGCVNIGEPYNNRFDSFFMKNGTGYVIAYDGANCSGQTIDTAFSTTSGSRAIACVDAEWSVECMYAASTAPWGASSFWYYRS